MIESYLSALPKEIIAQVELDDNRIVIPTKVKKEDFYKACANKIDSDVEEEAFPEKIIYACLIPRDVRVLPDISDLLNEMSKRTMDR